MTTERKHTASAAHTKDRPADATEEAAAGSEHVIVDIGKGTRKQVRKLRKGKPGKLLSRVDEAVAHLRSTGAVAEGTQVVVLIVRERRRIAGNMVGKMMGLG